MLGFFKKQNLNKAEALGVLGLPENADRRAIIKAHRSKMRVFHPDRGGDQYNAARINWARDILLSK